MSLKEVFLILIYIFYIYYNILFLFNTDKISAKITTNTINSLGYNCTVYIRHFIRHFFYVFLWEIII